MYWLPKDKYLTASHTIFVWVGFSDISNPGQARDHPAAKEY